MLQSRDVVNPRENTLKICIFKGFIWHFLGKKWKENGQKLVKFNEFFYRSQSLGLTGKEGLLPFNLMRLTSNLSKILKIYSVG